MIYDLKERKDIAKAEAVFKMHLERQATIELKRITNNRSTKQNSALHLFYTFISSELNELGLQYQYTGITGNTFELPYTDKLVKEFIWRPIQLALFNIKSTKKIDTKQMNEVMDVIINFFAEKEIVLKFQSFETLMQTI